MHPLPFSRIAIQPIRLFDDLDFLPDLQRDVFVAHNRGADAYYLRAWKSEVTHQLDEGFLAMFPEIEFIVPYAAFAKGVHARTVHYSSIDPAVPIAGIRCGKSCHTVEEVKEAEEAGFDYVFLSPIFSTATHPEAKPLGMSALVEAAQSSTIPIFALGGITADREAECIGHGAFGIAAVGMFVN